MPDALAFGRFNLSGSPGNGYQCTELSYLHSASFGIFMLQRTMTESFSFDARGFAIGFAGHVFGDFIGFFSKLLNNHRRGLLCAQHVGECKADILYLPLWSLMADMDAYFAMTNNIVASTLPDVSGIGQESYDFIASSSKLYNAQIDSSFKPVQASAVEQCVNFWRGNQQWVYQRAKLFTENALMREALLNEIQFFSTFNATTELSSFAAQQVNCAATLINSALQLAATKTSPLVVQQKALQQAVQLYSQGDCSP
eukprot:TRINITY_DN1371_c0_g1_i1.p1 TRINITY_DN1371_c0_g1~~TRINITY_DN1371_c0_g1_i1.p1  ORF type:complete len:255 (-),score=48.16 TRINITY_DN1371_c0_g1_i1:32-796(-)